jgi:hypothetical protein
MGAHRLIENTVPTGADTGSGDLMSKEPEMDGDEG